MKRLSPDRALVIVELDWTHDSTRGPYSRRSLLRGSNTIGFDVTAVQRRPAWLDALRKAGSERFALVGFPNNRQEEWRFTNTAPIVRHAFKYADSSNSKMACVSAAETAGRFSFGSDASSELVFVNGRLCLELSTLRTLPRGVQVATLADAIAVEHPAVRAAPFAVRGYRRESFRRVKHRLCRRRCVRSFLAWERGRKPDSSFVRFHSARQNPRSPIPGCLSCWKTARSARS